MAYDPSSTNYGRHQRGQLSPFRDTAQRRHAAFDEEEQEQQPEEQPAAPLAQAIYPQAPQKSFASKQQTQPIVDQVRSEARSSGSLSDAVRPAQRMNASRMSATPGPLTYAGGDGQGSFTGASMKGGTSAIESAMGWDPSQKQQQASASPLEKAIAPASGGGLSQPVGVGQFNLEGYDYSRFGDPNGRGNNTWKYRIGSVMSNYDPNDPSQVNAMVTDLQSKGVPVTFDGKDKLTFGPEVTDENGNQIGTIDVIRGAGAAGAGWAWQPLGGVPTADPLATAVGGSVADPVAMTLAQQLGIDTTNPLWKQILDQLIADQSGQTGNTPPHATIQPVGRDEWRAYAG